MNVLESHRLAERLAYLGRSLTTDAVRSLKMKVAYPRPRLNPKAEGCRRPRDETPYVSECRRALWNLQFGDLSRSRKELYRGLVVGSASDPLAQRLGWSVEKVRFHWNWAAGSGFLNNSEFSLTSRLARSALAYNDWAYRACIADMPDCPCCALYYCERVHPFWSHFEEWTARISPRGLVLLDVGYVLDNVDPPFQGESVWCFSWSLLWLEW